MTGVRFGIAGCGRIAGAHVEEILASPRAELVAVCDIDPAALDRFTRRHGVEGHRDYAELLARKDVDVVVICTPGGLHAGMGIMAARAGKHVLVEKPLALTMEDADMLIDTCEREGVILSVVLQNRFKPPFQLLKTAVAEGRFGKLSHAGVTVRWNRDEAYYLNNPWRGRKAGDGGVMMNQAIHSIDMLQWLMGRVESLFAYTATRYRPIEAEDVGVAVLKFESGALGVIEAASTVYPVNLEESIAVFGERGTAVIGGVKAGEIKTWRFSGAGDGGGGGDELSPVGCDAAGLGITGHGAVLQDMIKAVERGGTPAVDGREGRKSLEIVTGIYRSAGAGRPVSLPLI